jgi:hypothetical protein
VFAGFQSVADGLLGIGGLPLAAQKQCVGILGERVLSAAYINGFLKRSHGLVILAEALLRHTEPRNNPGIS